MRRHFFLLMMITLACGCRTPDPSVDLLEGELRWMEDQLYMLEDELEKKCDELASCRNSADCPCNRSSKPTAPAAPARRGGEVLPAPAEPRPAVKPPRTTPSTTRPDIDTIPPANSNPTTPPDRGSTTETDPMDEEFGDLEPPEVNIPDTGGFESEIDEPGAGGLQPGTEPLLEEPLPPPGQNGGAFESQSFQQPLASRKAATGVIADISHIVVRVTVPASAGQQSVADGNWVIAADEPDRAIPQVDESLNILVETRNEDGQYIGVPGPVSVVILDDTEEGDTARVGRWDFDAAAVRVAMKRTAKGQRGIELQIPWAEIGRTPDHLHMFVRYTTVDGRQLENEILLAEAPSPTDETAEQWTPSTRRPSGNRSGDSQPIAAPPAWAPYR